MRKAGEIFRKPFISALCGGLIVAVAGLLAIDAGWIEAEAPEPEAGPPVTVSQPAADSGEETGRTIGEIYADEGRGVAFIEARIGGERTDTPFGFPEQGPRGQATGSGFVVDNSGKILTNHHVVDGAEAIEVKIGDSETVYEAEIAGRDPATDLALLEVDAPPDALFPLELGDSSQVQVGEPVIAIGNPFGLDRTVTSGIVSALQRQIQAPNGFSISNVIQTDAPINPGSSGGPLLDASGRVIGINSQIQTGGLSGGNVGIGFAVPIDTARDVIAQIEETGTVEHAFMGITGATVDSQMAEALNLPVESGVLVQEVTEGGPADEAGLQGGDTPATLGGTSVSLGGDIIVELGGERVSAMDEVIAAVNEADPGDRVRLKILRGGEERDATLTLGTRPDSAE